jgi:hypothetical protein
MKHLWNKMDKATTKKNKLNEGAQGNDQSPWIGTESPRDSLIRCRITIFYAGVTSTIGSSNVFKVSAR